MIVYSIQGYMPLKKHPLSINTKDKFDVILYNSIVLYILVFLSFVFVVYHAYLENFIVVLIFFSVGLLCSFFSKNMTVILFSAITISFVVKWVVVDVGNLNLDKLTSQMEGFDNQESEPETSKKKSSDTNTSSLSEIMSSNTSNSIQRIHEQTKQLIETQKNIIDDVEKLKPFVEKMTLFSEKLSEMSNKK